MKRDDESRMHSWSMRAAIFCFILYCNCYTVCFALLDFIQFLCMLLLQKLAVLETIIKMTSKKSWMCQLKIYFYKRKYGLASNPLLLIFEHKIFYFCRCYFFVFLPLLYSSIFLSLLLFFSQINCYKYSNHIFCITVELELQYYFVSLYSQWAYWCRTIEM